VHGWPESWYAWRLLMPALARDFQVIAVDQRGMGLSDKPQDGYDTGTQAGDLVALMDALGHQRFAVVGHDTGFATGRAAQDQAADHARPGDRRRSEFGENVGNAVRAVADDVQSLVIPGVGHFLAEEAPDEMLAALTAFLAPYRDGAAAVPAPRRHAADVSESLR
jgi:pimeloyl-ACP methyl ester carboxylesterase